MISSACSALQVTVGRALEERKKNHNLLLSPAQLRTKFLDKSMWPHAMRSHSPCMICMDKQYPRKWQINFQNSQTLARQNFCAWKYQEKAYGYLEAKHRQGKKNHEELTGFCQPSCCCSLFCACQKHTATRLKTKLAPRFSMLFFL